MNITDGPIFSALIRYAIPIMLGTLIQVAFNAADLMVVGNMGSDTAVAAVGATTSIVGLLVTSSVGLSAGVKAVLARCIGKKDVERTKRVVNTSMISSLAIGVIIMTAMLLFGPSLLRVTNCPNSCFDEASLYLKIYAPCVPLIFVYNFGAAIIRTAGDSATPFRYLVLSGAANFILNVAFCFIMSNKVAAVALATALSNLIGTVLTSLYLIRGCGIIRFSFRDISFSFSDLSSILKIGVPSAFNSALFSLSNLQMHAEINSYGEAATAGNAAASNLEGFVSAIYGGLMVSTVTFVGQNVGAGKSERVKKSILNAELIGFVVTFFLGIGIYLCGNILLPLYVPDNEAALAFGMSRMKYIMIPQFVSSVFGILVSSMQAFGYSLVPMINSTITVLGFRILWLETIYPKLIDHYGRNINCLYSCYTISWLLSLLVHSLTFAIVYRRYKQGKIKKL